MLKTDDFSTADAKLPRFSELPHDPEPPDAASFIRSHPGAQQFLEELDGQPAQNFKPLLASSLPPHRAAAIGQRLLQELESLARRDRLTRDMASLASGEAADLSADQLRRVLEFVG